MFYVMEFVEGVVIRTVEEAEQHPVELRKRMGRSLIEVLACIHGVDVDAARGEIAADQLSLWRGEMGGPEASRSHYVYGPESPSEFQSLLAHAGGLPYTVGG